MVVGHRVFSPVMLGTGGGKKAPTNDIRRKREKEGGRKGRTPICARTKKKKKKETPRPGAHSYQHQGEEKRLCLTLTCFLWKKKIEV